MLNSRQIRSRAYSNRLAGRFITITLAIWLVMTVWAFLVQSKLAFYGVGALAGVAMGIASWKASSRPIFSLI